jgi:DNA-binding NarL/FixJ family response regulator
MDRIRVLIADDHPLFRDGIHGLLDSLATWSRSDP